MWVECCTVMYLCPAMSKTTLMIWFVETPAKQSKVTKRASIFNELTTLTAESSTSAVKTTTERPVCWCPCLRLNVTKQEFIEELVQALEISKANLSSTRRRRISVYERRTVPVTLGSVWVGVLLALYGVVLFSDISLHGKSSMRPSSRGYGYGKRKVRPVDQDTSSPTKRWHLFGRTVMEVRIFHCYAHPYHAFGRLGIAWDNNVPRYYADLWHFFDDR